MSSVPVSLHYEYWSSSAAHMKHKPMPFMVYFLHFRSLLFFKHSDDTDQNITGEEWSKDDVLSRCLQTSAISTFAVQIDMDVQISSSCFLNG
jgi:hypothetical protein